MDLPVGVGDTRKRRSGIVELGRDSAIVFYTDGLVERRGEVIDEGLRRLCQLIRIEPAENICAAIMAGMEVGAAEDDIAVLAVRVRP